MQHLIVDLCLYLALDKTRGRRISSLATSGPQGAPTPIHLRLCGTNPQTAQSPTTDVTQGTAAAGHDRPRNQTLEEQEDLFQTGGRVEGAAAGRSSEEAELRGSVSISTLHKIKIPLI